MSDPDLAGYRIKIFWKNLIGEMPERLNGPHSKCGRPARVSGVQIPLSPKFYKIKKRDLKRKGVDPLRQSVSEARKT